MSLLPIVSAPVGRQLAGAQSARGVRRPMALISVSDLAYCRLRLPDLDKAEQFLLDFGLVAAGTLDGRRYYRGSDPSPYCYVTELGDERFLGFAFRAKTAADLDRLAAQTDARIESIDGPGGGTRVRLKEPNGYDVDVVWGIKPAPAIAVVRQPYNSGSAPLVRKGELYRLPPAGVTPVKRLAHVVLATPKVVETIAWFKSTLGLISSDDIVAGPGKTPLGSFLRLDEGDDYVDHHSVFVIGSPTAGLQHLSFEVQDIDAVLADHHHLKSLGRYEHLWGIGRHLLGSQVFDYWSDPFGYPHEHWADSDRLNAAMPSTEWDAHEGLVNQWGEPPPERFRTAVKA